MAAPRQNIRAEDVHGFKYFKALRGLIERLHVVGIARGKAGNRNLHMDQYCTLILLWFFSPIVDSLRGLQQASELDKVRKHFGVGRASLGSLSEGVAVFDPQPLKEIAHELFDQLPDVSAGRFDVVGQPLTAVDGSIVETLARVARLCAPTTTNLDGPDSLAGGPCSSRFKGGWLWLGWWISGSVRSGSTG
jgi:hypothetical protein